MIQEKMLGLAALIALLLGGLWLADTLFDCRFFLVDTLYPFQPAMRQTAALFLLGTGAMLAWVESRLHVRRLHH